MMATEVQSGDLDSATSSRLEVSIDGLTLSPDPEGEQSQAEEPNPVAEEPETDTSGFDDGEDGETGKTAIERKWGFSLQELYEMALKFFKGILTIVSIVTLPCDSTEKYYRQAIHMFKPAGFLTLASPLALLAAVTVWTAAAVILGITVASQLAGSRLTSFWFVGKSSRLWPESIAQNWPWLLLRALVRCWKDNLPCIEL